MDTHRCHLVRRRACRHGSAREFSWCVAEAAGCCRCGGRCGRLLFVVCCLLFVVCFVVVCCLLLLLLFAPIVVAVGHRLTSSRRQVAASIPPGLPCQKCLFALTSDLQLFCFGLLRSHFQRCAWWSHRWLEAGKGAGHRLVPHRRGNVCRHDVLRRSKSGTTAGDWRQDIVSFGLYMHACLGMQRFGCSLTLTAAVCRCKLLLTIHLTSTTCRPPTS